MREPEELATRIVGTSKRLIRSRLHIACAVLLMASYATGPGIVDATAAQAKRLKVAVLVAGAANDGGFDQVMIEGVQAAAKADGNTDVTVREKLADQGTQAMGDVPRQFADQGYDLIVAHG